MMVLSPQILAQRICHPRNHFQVFPIEIGLPINRYHCLNPLPERPLALIQYAFVSAYVLHWLWVIQNTISFFNRLKQSKPCCRYQSGKQQD